MNATTVAFQNAYARAFRAFLADDAEPNRHAAYELGRDAVGGSLGLLDLAHAHHEVLLAELVKADSAGDVRRITLAGDEFLLEALSAYEMIRRGFTEAREAVASERRQARMLRQLSTMLADASLAVHAQSSLEEVLQLVVEQAVELTDAGWCTACVTNGSADPTIACAGATPPTIDDVVREALAAIAVDTTRTEVVRVANPSVPSEAAAVALTALDGKPIGVFAVAPSPARPFTALDQAVLVHIGQMTSAALERATGYYRCAPRGGRP